jgi:galactose mutarotase-like enzyme
VHVHVRLGLVDPCMRPLPTAAEGRHTLATRDISATVMPGYGAKIISLRSVRSGREWLVPSNAVLEALPPLGAPFEMGTVNGADECLPTIAPCFSNGGELPDHGEVWTQGWTLDTVHKASGRIHTAIDLPLSPFRFERTISADRDQEGMAFDYQLTNLSNTVQRFLWAFHPIFAITGGERLVLPDSIKTVRVGAQRGFPQGASTWSWPSPMPSVRLDHLDTGTYGTSYVKLFADYSKIIESFATIVSGAEALSFRFESESIPALGIWLTRGAWHGHTHFAVEPTNGATDSLNSVHDSPQTTVPAGGTRTWRFRLTVQPTTISAPSLATPSSDVSVVDLTKTVRQPRRRR